MRVLTLNMADGYQLPFTIVDYFFHFVDAAHPKK